VVKKTTALIPQTLKTQHDMKLQYCKPETEVDYLELENDFLASTESRSTQTTIVDDMGEAEDIYW
jgi:hypothetical protein